LEWLEAKLECSEYICKKLNQMTANLFKCLFYCLLFFVANLSFGQKNHFGFYLGPTLSSLKLEQKAAADVIIDPFDYKFGFTVGGFGTIGLSDNVSLRGEFNFERKGGRSGLLLSDGHGNPLPGRHIDEHFDYLQFPVLFQLGAGKDFKVFFHMGYAFGYLLHRTSDFPDKITIVVDQEPAPPKSYILLMPEAYNTIDHSIVAGIGASPLLSNGMRVQFGLRAYNGKLNISKGESAFDAKNLSVALIAGLEF